MAQVESRRDGPVGIITLSKHAARLAASPDVVTRAVHHALTARMPKLRYLVGPEARGLGTLHALAPARLFDWGLHESLGLLSRLSR